MVQQLGLISFPLIEYQVTIKPFRLLCSFINTIREKQIEMKRHELIFAKMFYSYDYFEISIHWRTIMIIRYIFRDLNDYYPM